MSIALVSVDWFKTLSNNLKVSVDFNFKENGNNKWSIIKSENIKTLVLNFGPNNFFFKKMITTTLNSRPPILLGVNKLNEKLKSLSTIKKKQQQQQQNIKSQYDSDNEDGGNGIEVSFDQDVCQFKKIIIREFELKSIPMDSKIIKSLYQCNAVQNIHLCEFELDNRITLKKLQESTTRVKGVLKLVLIDCFDRQVITHALKVWNKSIKRLSITVSNQVHGNGNRYQLFEMLSSSSSSSSSSQSKPNLKGKGKKINTTTSKTKNKKKDNNSFFEGLESLEINGIEFQLGEIVEQLVSSPNLLNYSMNICIDNLIYFLSNDQEKIEHQISRCNCNSLIFKDEDNLFVDQIKEFNLHWLQLIDKISKLKLNQFKLVHQCHGNGNNYQLSTWGSKQLPNSVVLEISNLISSIGGGGGNNFKTLEKLTLEGINTTQIFNQTLKENKNIQYCESTVNGNRDCNFTEYIQDLEILVKNYNYIKKFQFKNNIYNTMTGENNLKILFNYKTCKNK